MQTPLIDGADIDRRRVRVLLEDDRKIPLRFRKDVRRVTIYDDGKRMFVETADGEIIRFTAEQITERAKPRSPTDLADTSTREPLIHGADIKGRRATIRMDGDRVVPLGFRTRIRRITIYDNGKGIVVETVDRKLKRFTAEQLIVRAKGSA